jgi:hypothetical protein
MPVIVQFQGPDFNEKRQPDINTAVNNQPDFTVEGFDLDYATLTVYPRDRLMDVNLTLARRVKLMNEDGVECGKIAWKIEPEQALLDVMPEIAPWVGYRYGRVIVTSEDQSKQDLIGRLYRIHHQSRGKGDQGAFDVWNEVASILSSRS